MKKLLLVLGILGVLLVMAVAVLSLPAVQRRLVTAFVDGPETEFRAADLRFWLGGFEARDVVIHQDGLSARVEHASGRFSVGPLVFARRLVVDDLTIRGLLIEPAPFSPAPPAAERPVPEAGAPADHPGPTPQAGPAEAPAPRPIPGSEPAPAARPPAPARSEPFEGILQPLDLPVEVVLRRVHIDGVVRVPPSDVSPSGDLRFQISGGNFAPGETARFESLLQWRGTPTDDLPLAVLDSEGSLEIRQGRSGEFHEIRIANRFAAEGPGWPDRRQLDLNVVLARTAAGEEYRVQVDAPDPGMEGRLFALTADFEEGRQDLRGSWEAAFRHEQVEPFLLAIDLPAFSANGSGEWSVATDGSGGTAQGSLVAEGSRWEAIMPELAGIDPLRLEAAFDVLFGPDLVRSEEFSLSVTNPAGQSLVSVRQLRPLQLDPETRRAQAIGDGREVLRAEFRDVPAIWAAPFLAQAAIRDGLFSGVFLLEEEGEDLIVSSPEPMRLTGLAVEMEGPIPPRIDVAMSPHLLWRGGEIRAGISALTIAGPDGELLAAELEAVLPSGPDASIHLTAGFQASGTALPAEYSALRGASALGRLSAEARDGGVWLRESQFVLNRAPGEPALTLDLRRPLFISEDGPVLGTEALELASIRFSGIPLSWAELAAPEMELQGFLAEGVLMISAGGGAYGFVSEQPLLLQGVSVTSEGEPLLRDLDVRVRVGGEYGEGIAFRLAELSVMSGLAPLLQASAEASLVDLRSGSVGMRMDVDLAGWLRQPVAAGQAHLDAGRMTASFDADLAERSQIRGDLRLVGLRTIDGEDLAPIAAVLEVDQEPDQQIRVRIPVTAGTQQLASRMQLTADVRPQGEGYHFEAALTGDQVVVDHFLPFAAIIPEAPPDPVALERDERPLWSGVTGTAQVDLRAVRYGDGQEVRDVHAVVRIEPDRIQVEPVRAVLNDSPVQASGGLRFVDTAARPYQLDGRLSLSGFDAGRFFASVNPGEPPAVEGKFDLNGQASGDGIHLAELMDRVQGEVRLENQGGIFRALGRTGQTTAVVTGLLGALTGSRELNVVSQFATRASEIRAEQMLVQVVRDETLDFRLTEFLLVDPEIRLTGQGTIRHVEGEPLHRHPLSVEMRLEARGSMAQLLGSVNLLTAEADEAGYYPMRNSFRVGGTLENIDTRQLYEILGRAAAGGASRLLDRGATPAQPQNQQPQDQQQPAPEPAPADPILDLFERLRRR